MRGVVYLTVASLSLIFFNPVLIFFFVGKDGRRYLIDLSRTFPPTMKTSFDHPSSHLFRLFRPEFMKIYSDPLSPDAYSSFFTKESESQQSILSVMKAHKYLQEVLIPKSAKVVPPPPASPVCGRSPSGPSPNLACLWSQAEPFPTPQPHLNSFTI